MIYIVFILFAGPKKATVFLFCMIFISILALGACICFFNIKRLLKIKLFDKSQREKSSDFEKLPLWVRICRVAVIVLWPITVNIQISTYLEMSGMFIRVLSLILYFGCLGAVIFYACKKKDKS
jgi:hypothetical protein